MEKCLNQLDFDILACRYLYRIDATLNPENIAKAREIFKNDSDILLNAILSIDEARKINNDDHTVSVTKIKRRKEAA